MDSFLSLAKQGYSAYEESQSNSNRSGDDQERVTKTGGAEYNAPHYNNDYNNDSSQNRPQFDEDEVVRNASSHGSGDSSLFSSAMQHINSNPQKHEEPIDEDDAQEAHRQAYTERSAGGMSASSMGTAAAMEIMKKFTGGGGGSTKPNSQSDLISLAMAEASKLFDNSGGAANGNKQDVVNSAGMTIMKLMVQSKLGSGGSSGGLGGLMSIAGKFM